MTKKKNIMKQEAEHEIEAYLSNVLPCPFCGIVPTFDIKVGEQSKTGATLHQAVRRGCCKATGQGQTELFFVNDFKKPAYDLWAWMVKDLVEVWNKRI